MKTKLILFGVISILTIGAYLLGIQTTKQQVNQQKDEVKALNQSLQKEKETNDVLSERAKRQSKTVIAEEEKQIRETAQNFTKELFTTKKGTSFKDKSKTLKPLITEKYYDTLFSDGREKFSIFDDITISDIHVYFEQNNPKNDNYKVFVQFNERIDTEGQKEVENRKTSVQLDLVRTNDKWLINDVQRFNLQKNGRG
ncbi:hypothetical protein SE116_11485 [Staphylococcus aureus]|uniref:hypothetical protein n=1 Tax=Staphylococcus aureus TaxID=1280 RepID=UPI0029C0EAB5|nr:hypothetical protein [Staphylococcus aureus]WPF96929.1 hypothetical protein SE111_00945 [Staphylococcus aureus]WPF98891.1 hypothetical protein SE116_11485 [Staphylococcus aureus]